MRVIEGTDEHGASGGVLVPTMGALHGGHSSLIKRGAQLAQERGVRCIVSAFVNRTQFNDPRDFEKYPRTLEADAELCRACGADVLWAPAQDVVYPPGVEVAVPPLPAVATEPGLEDAGRPGHFAGVCQVVLRLFELTSPIATVFGEKDWQQLVVTRAMIEMQGLGIELFPGETVREEDGLAMSSRNRFLDPSDRVRAVSINRALSAAGRTTDPIEAERVMRDVMGESGIDPEYAVVRDSETLLEPRGGACRAVVTAVVGGVRLLDNAPWPNNDLRPVPA